MSHMFDDAAKRLRALYEAGQVTRAHALPTLFKHTIAEHCYGMGCAAAWLCEINNFSPEEVGKVLEAVLYHDAPEVHTGDVPAHIKKLLPEVDAALHNVERRWREEHYVPEVSLNSDAAAILDVADRVDLAMLCVQERRMGNKASVIATVFNRAMEYAGVHAELKGVPELLTFCKLEWFNAAT